MVNYGFDIAKNKVEVYNKSEVYTKSEVDDLVGQFPYGIPYKTITQVEVPANIDDTSTTGSNYVDVYPGIYLLRLSAFFPSISTAQTDMGMVQGQIILGSLTAGRGLGATRVPAHSTYAVSLQVTTFAVVENTTIITAKLSSHVKRLASGDMSILRLK